MDANGYRNKIQDYRQLSELLLESQAAIGKPEQDPGGFLEQFSLLVSDFIIEASSIIIEPKIVKTIGAHLRSTVLIFKTFKKIFIS
jgi:hypothetical protein